MIKGSGQAKVETPIGDIKEYPSFTHSDLDVLKEHNILSDTNEIEYLWEALNSAKDNLIKSDELGWTPEEELDILTRWNPKNWLRAKPMESICSLFNVVGGKIHNIDKYVKENIISYDGCKFHEENCKWNNCKCVEPKDPFLYKDTYDKLIEWINTKKRYYNNYLEWIYDKKPWETSECSELGLAKGTSAKSYAFDISGGNKKKSYRKKKYRSKRR